MCPDLAVESISEEEYEQRSGILSNLFPDKSIVAKIWFEFAPNITKSRCVMRKGKIFTTLKQCKSLVINEFKMQLEKSLNEMRLASQQFVRMEQAGELPEAWKYVLDSVQTHFVKLSNE